MSGSGVLILVIAGVVVVAAAVFALFYFRLGVFRRRKARGHGRSPLLSEGRIEVLESTQVDPERRLVLVRCDRIEHLILVGGPADVVVENDVKKARGPGAPAPKSATADAGQRASGGLADILSTSAPPSERPAIERPAPAAAEKRSLAAPRPASPPAVPSRVEGGRVEEPRDARQRSVDSPLVRRENTQQQRRTIQPKPLGGPRPEPARERHASQGRGNGRAEEGPPLPAAGVPWVEPDSIENEIVRALRFDPVPRTGGSATTPRAPASSKTEADPGTTLGDLADKLEEALAQEVQAAGRVVPALDLESDEFGFGERPAPRGTLPVKHEDDRSRSIKKDMPRATPERMAATPEPERRRDAPGTGERREEAPVISLNARRRESADPLEDEMARLLGELTGDTKGR